MTGPVTWEIQRLLQRRVVVTVRWDEQPQEAQGCNNPPPQYDFQPGGLYRAYRDEDDNLVIEEVGDSRVMPTGPRGQEAERRPGSSDTGT